VALGKGSTTHGRFEDGVMDVLGEAAFDEVEFLAHGTTVTINTLTEHRGAVTALLTTRGFRDVLEITRANRPDLYTSSTVSRSRSCRGGSGLRWPTGQLQGRSAGAARRRERTNGRRRGAAAGRRGDRSLLDPLVRNPEHERRATKIVREEWAEVAVTASPELVNERLEYDRTSTVVLDAYMKPTAGRYLDALASVAWLDDLAGLRGGGEAAQSLRRSG
jgi:N-methylhydantoinase A